MSDLTYLRPEDSTYEPALISGRINALLLDVTEAGAQRCCLPEEYRFYLANHAKQLDRVKAAAERQEKDAAGLRLMLTEAIQQRAADTALIAELHRGLEYATSEAAKARQDAMSWQARCEMTPVVVPFRGVRP